eukprot:SAG22_NODE_20952_length_261_cov_0.641975_1_plen_32_part_10
MSEEFSEATTCFVKVDGDVAREVLQANDVKAF